MNVEYYTNRRLYIAQAHECGLMRYLIADFPYAVSMHFRSCLLADRRIRRGATVARQNALCTGVHAHGASPLARHECVALVESF